MAGGAGVRRPTLRTVVAVSVMAGVVLGAGAFALDPLPVRAALGAGTTVSAGPPTAATETTTSPDVTPAPTRATRSATPTPTPSRSPSSTPKPTPESSPSRHATPTGPPFTRLALLQTSELLQHGWGEATELSLQEGVVKPSLLRCVRPDRLAQEPVDAYAATYESLRTQATEQVARFASVADARAALDRLVDQVGGCASVTADLRATVGARHEPDLEGISEAVWWNLRGAGSDDRMRGVLTLVRVDDRIVVLYLHSSVTDPAKTTDVLPLVRQAGLRLV